MLSIKLNKTYLALSIALFLVEVLIAIYVKDSFIRPHVGDFLVVILIYCFVRAFWDVPIIPTAIGVWIFSFVVEGLQYFRIVDLLGLGEYPLARVIIGTTFNAWDLLAYSLGVGFLLVVEMLSSSTKMK